jgi:hypothetical protein
VLRPMPEEAPVMRIVLLRIVRAAFVGIFSLLVWGGGWCWCVVG